jgi:hypothetical protein
MAPPEALRTVLSFVLPCDDPPPDPSPGWIPMDTYLPADVNTFRRGQLVEWVGNAVLAFLQRRILMPGTTLEVCGQQYEWAGPMTHVRAKQRFNAALLRLPDDTLCVVSLTHLFGAIAEFLPRQPEA